MPMQTTDQWGSFLPKGLGNDQEATQATGAMRQSPWYQDWAKKNNLQFEGDSYGNAKLNDSQQQDLYNQALQHGIGLNDKYDQIDENGQISEAHHKLRNTLIALAIGGAAATGFGAAGIGPLAGMMGGASAAGAGAGAGVGLGEAGATGIGALSATSLGLPVTAGLGTAGAAGATAAGLGAGAGIGLGETGATGIGGLSATSLGLPTTAGLGSAGGAATGLGAGALSTIPDLGAVGESSSLPGFLSTEGIYNSLPGAVAGPGVQGMSGGGGIINKILGLANGKAGEDPLSTISSLLGSASSGAKANRVVEGNFAGQFDRNSIAAQDSANSARSAAMHDLAVANYLKNAGGHTPSSIMLNGQQHQLSDYGFGPKAPSTEQREGGTMLGQTALKTLGPNGTYSPMPFSNYGTPGAGENALSTGATIAGMLPSSLSILKMFRK